MKKKLILTMLSLVMGLTLIAGGTLAWFTDNTSVADTTFTAGKLEIGAELNALAESNRYDNVNPGDILPDTWTITNTGTKRLFLRAYVDNKEWTNNLPTENVSFKLQENSNWVFNQEDGYYYYGTQTIPPLSGPGDTFPIDYTTVDTESNKEVIFPLNTIFSGPNTGNEYQEETFTFDVFFEAIQVTNHGDDVDPWSNYTEDGLPAQP